MEQDALFNFINDTFNRTDKRLGDVQAQNERQSSQLNGVGLELQKLTGIVEQLNRRFEYDLKVYLDGEKNRLDSVLIDLEKLKTDRTKLGTLVWAAGTMWAILVTTVTLWFSGFGSFIGSLIHRQ